MGHDDTDRRECTVKRQRGGGVRVLGYVWNVDSTSSLASYLAIAGTRAICQRSLEDNFSRNCNRTRLFETNIVSRLQAPSAALG